MREHCFKRSDDAESSALPFKRIKTTRTWTRPSPRPARQKPVMLDFSADWCVACKELEHDTYTDPRCRRPSGAVLLQADVTANDEDDKALFKRFGLFGPPSVMFFGGDGQELRQIGWSDTSDLKIS